MILKEIFFLLFFFSAYDRAAIKFRGVEADINFSLEDYEEDLKQVERGFTLSCTVPPYLLQYFDSLF